MKSYQQKYLLCCVLITGIIIGMIQHDIVIPVFNEAENIYYHGRRGDNNIALIFNVDWGQEYIPTILKILENDNIKVTFFVTGRWSRQFPAILKQMSENGHEIGNHGYKHQHPENLNRQEIINMLVKNEDLIYEITGIRTNLFSPPYGEVDKRIAAIVASQNYKTVMWSADTIDWQRPAPEIIVQRALNKIDDGGIILMHPTKPTTKALPEIIYRLKRRGYNFVKVSRLIL